MANKTHQIRFRPGLCPGPRWGSSRRSPRPTSRMSRSLRLELSLPLLHTSTLTTVHRAVKKRDAYQ